MLKLPKDVAADTRHDAVWNILTTNTTPLWEGAKLQVPTFALNHGLADECRQSISDGLAIPGLEAMSKLLASEQKGLDALIAKAPNAPQNPRVSRLLLMSNDASKRFYRNCEALLAQYDQRVIGCRLEVTGVHFGSVVFGKPKLVHAVLFVDKKAVARALLSLVPQ